MGIAAERSWTRLDAARRNGHARADRPAHAPAVRRRRATPRSSCASAATPTSRSWPRAAASSRPCAMTRAASDDELLDHGRRWLAEMLSHGVTTVEAKSGYGLDTRQRAAPAGARGPARRRGPGRGRAHVPRRARRRARVPRPPGRGRGLPRPRHQRAAAAPSPSRASRTFCDVFCERGVFDAAQSRRLLDAAREAGPGAAPARRPDQRRPAAPQLAADSAPLSADHLAAISDDGHRRARRAPPTRGRPVVATLLPVTELLPGRASTTRPRDG